jgi:hypothetical protein
MTQSPEDPRLSRLSGICLALPKTSRELNGSHARFLVGKKTFAYYLHDHHGDGMVAIACKVLPGDNTILATSQPARFYLPAYIASRGWVAMRLDIGVIDWEEVSEFVSGGYQLVASKR